MTLSNFEELAVYLKPLRLQLVLAMAIFLIGGVLAASRFEQNRWLGAIGFFSMVLAWWCWILFISSRVFAPENRDQIDSSIFPRFNGVIYVSLKAFMIIAFAFPFVVLLFSWLHY
jgi:hypothetical protein